MSLPDYLIKSCFFSIAFSLSKSGDCLNSRSCSSCSCLTADNAILDTSFMSFSASSARICSRMSSSFVGSSFLKNFVNTVSFLAGFCDSSW